MAESVGRVESVDRLVASEVVVVVVGGAEVVGEDEESSVAVRLLLFATCFVFVDIVLTRGWYLFYNVLIRCECLC